MAVLPGVDGLENWLQEPFWKIGYRSLFGKLVTGAFLENWLQEPFWKIGYRSLFGKLVTGAFLENWLQEPFWKIGYRSLFGKLVTGAFIDKMPRAGTQCKANFQFGAGQSDIYVEQDAPQPTLRTDYAQYHLRPWTCLCVHLRPSASICIHLRIVDSPMPPWTCPLVLDSSRKIVAGSQDALVRAIRRGADLRIYTEFRHNEHIDVRSSSDEKVREVAEFAVTYLVEDRWAAGLMSLRQPVSLPDGFGPRPSMSFFLYNQDGHQALGRPHLDGQKTVPAPEGGPHPMPKYHLLDSHDPATNAPSHNFIYDFDIYKFYVADTWEEVLHHDAHGRVLSGSIDTLATAFGDGAAIKVGIGGLCADLPGEGNDLAHEVFVETGSGYYYVEQQLFIAGSHPVIRVRPSIPMRYQSKGWDFGWLVLHTDGAVVYRQCDPYSLAFADGTRRHPIRWFAR